MGTMYPHKIIYDADTHVIHSEVSLHAGKFARFMYNFLRGAGIGLIIFVVLSFVVSIEPIIREEIVYYIKNTSENNSLQETHLTNLPIVEQTIAVQNEAKSYGVDPHFSIVIPKIDARANIIPNVSAVNAPEYSQALQKGIAHAAGTYFPGQGKNIYLFSHSTDFEYNVARYNAVFYLLRKLERGDRIIVYFSDERFIYEVQDKFIVNAVDTKWLTEETETETLYLQTCDPPGTTWKRLIVKAVPVES
ncbi:sortase [Candidatus Woesebacteria bacterium]|nr:MAG: sortase [Candidatus Woesebacteria bacterium]